MTGKPIDKEKIKGYHGETVVGLTNRNLWTAYVWLDQELKKEMTGR